MNHREDDFRKICFHCASIYEAEDRELLVCPICGKSIPISEYERIMQGIRQAVFGGPAVYNMKTKKMRENITTQSNAEKS